MTTLRTGQPMLMFTAGTPCAFDPPRGLLHLGGHRAVDLDRQRTILGARLGQLQGAPSPLDQRPGVDQVGRRQPQPAAAPHRQPEGQARVTGQRRQEEPRRDRQLAQMERLAHNGGDFGYRTLTVFGQDRLPHMARPRSLKDRGFQIADSRFQKGFHSEFKLISIAKSDRRARTDRRGRCDDPIILLQNPRGTSPERSGRRGRVPGPDDRPGSTLLDEVAAVRSIGPADLERLRKQAPAGMVAAAVRLTLARRKAAAKFERGDRMWVEPIGVEQATAEPVARHKASGSPGLLRSWSTSRRDRRRYDRAWRRTRGCWPSTWIRACAGALPGTPRSTKSPTRSCAVQARAESFPIPAGRGFTSTRIDGPSRSRGPGRSRIMCPGPAFWASLIDGSPPARSSSARPPTSRVISAGPGLARSS